MSSAANAISAQPAETRAARQFFKRGWFVTLLLVFFAPVGAVFVWAFTKWHMAVKVIATLWASLYLLVFLAGLSTPSEPASGAGKPQSAAPAAQASAPARQEAAPAAIAGVSDEIKAEAVALLGAAVSERQLGNLGITLELARQAVGKWPQYADARSFMVEVAPLATAAAQAASLQATAAAQAASAQATAGAQAANAQATAQAQAQATTEARVAAEATRAAAGIGQGTKIVGTDIAPGTYRSNSSGSGCYWERLGGFGGAMGDILDNDNATGPAVVTVAATDKGFSSARCAPWQPATGPITTSPAAPFADGTFIVGIDIAPGTWRTEGATGCYWERMRSFGGGVNAILANDNARGSAVVQIAAGDKGFKSKRCGTWTKIG